jgi:hypothetical protein
MHWLEAETSSAPSSAILHRQGSYQIDAKFYAHHRRPQKVLQHNQIIRGDNDVICFGADVGGLQRNTALSTSQEITGRVVESSGGILAEGFVQTRNTHGMQLDQAYRSSQQSRPIELTSTDSLAR